MTATVTDLPTQGRQAYVVHHRTPSEGVITRIGWGRNHSEALADSGLPNGSLHQAWGSCTTCDQALTKEVSTS